MDPPVRGEEVSLCHIGLDVDLRVGGAIICVHMWPLPFGWKFCPHRRWGKGAESPVMFFQILPQWRRWDLLKRHVMIIPRSTVSTPSRAPRISSGPVSLFGPSGPINSSSPIHSWCLTQKVSSSELSFGVSPSQWVVGSSCESRNGRRPPRRKVVIWS